MELDGITQKFIAKTSEYGGYVNTLPEALTILRDFKVQTSSEFIIFKKSKLFGVVDAAALKNHNIRLKYSQKDGGPKLPDDGVPILIHGKFVLDCKYGKDRCKAQKEKYKQNNTIKRSRPLGKATRKMGCSAQIHMREIYYFRDYKVSKDTNSGRRTALGKLRKDIDENVDVQFERRIYIQFPTPAEHSNHLPLESNAIDERLRDKIKSLYAEGVRTTDEMKMYSDAFVSKLFEGESLPDVTNRKFYPTKKDFRNIMSSSKNASKNSSINLVLVIDDEVLENNDDVSYENNATPDIHDEDDVSDNEVLDDYCEVLNNDVENSENILERSDKTDEVLDNSEVLVYLIGCDEVLHNNNDDVIDNHDNKDVVLDIADEVLDNNNEDTTLTVPNDVYHLAQSVRDVCNKISSLTYQIPTGAALREVLCDVHQSYVKLKHSYEHISNNSKATPNTHKETVEKLPAKIKRKKKVKEKLSWKRFHSSISHQYQDNADFS